MMSTFAAVEACHINILLNLLTTFALVVFPLILAFNLALPSVEFVTPTWVPLCEK